MGKGGQAKGQESMAETKHKKKGGCAGCGVRLVLWMMWILLAFAGGWLFNEYEAQGRNGEKAWAAGKTRLASAVPFLDAPATPTPPARRATAPDTAEASTPPSDSTPTREPRIEYEPDTDAETYRAGRAEEFPTLTRDMNAYAHGHVSYDRGITYYRQTMEGGGTPAHRIRLLHLAQHELSQALAAFQNAERVDPGNAHLLERIQETGTQLNLVRARLPR